MQAEYIEKGRFDKAIWITTKPDDFLIEYPHLRALPIGVALELWASLSKALIAAGQGGMLNTSEWQPK